MTRAIAILAVVAIVLLNGCETSRGLYRDMQHAGDWVYEKFSDQ
ncbi:hypothetical protein [Desulfuromonas acetoxidans]